MASNVPLKSDEPLITTNAELNALLLQDLKKAISKISPLQVVTDLHVLSTNIQLEISTTISKDRQLFDAYLKTKETLLNNKCINRLNVLKKLQPVFIRAYENKPTIFSIFAKIILA